MALPRGDGSSKRATLIRELLQRVERSTLLKQKLFRL